MNEKVSYPKVLYVLIVSCFLVPVVFYTPLAQFLGIFKFEEFLKIVTTPIMIGGYALNPCLAATFCILFRKMMNNLNPDDEASCAKFNKNLKSFYIGLIGAAIMFAVASAFGFTITAKMRIGNFPSFGKTNPIPVLLLLNLSLVCDGSLLFFMIFLQILERNLWKVRFQKNQLSLNIFMRNMCTVGFSSLGCFGIIIASLLVPANFARGRVFIFQLTLPIVICCMIIIMVLELLLVLDTRNIVKNVVNVTEDLEQKNYLIEDVPATSRSEFGILANSINRMKKTTRDILNKIASSSNTTIDKSIQLQKNMDNTRENVIGIATIIDEMQKHISNQKNEVNDTNKSVQKILNSIDELNRSVEIQSSSVKESSDAVEEMVQNVNSVSNILSQNNANVNKLSEASEKGQVTVGIAVNAAEEILKQSTELISASNVIQNIASQTNLLAMNAAIESAHAGEAGKGFAVVADEIRKLSEQSSTQAKTIDASLKSFSDSISSIAEEIKKVQSVFTVIYDYAQKVKDQERIISDAMQSQTEGSNHVIEAIQDINNVTGTVKRGTAEMLVNGEEISEVLKKFDALTVTMGEDIKKISDISEKITEVVELTEENSSETHKNLQGLLGELKEFNI